MSTLKEAILRSRNKAGANNLDAISAFMVQAAEQKITDLFEALRVELKEMTLEEFNNVVSSLKGEDGKTPTKEELDVLIAAQIPEPVHGKNGDNGKTPSEKELLRLIKSVMPKVKDGITPTRSELLALIIPLIPKVKSGEDGKDGSVITKKQLKEKINSISGGVEIAVIKGLATRLQTLEQMIRESNRIKRQHGGGSKGGGGMGNPQHETFTISAGTTAITTNYPIAAGGNAIFKSAYQGMALDKDVHFTVGANRKTITFDTGVAAQFENNTVFSLTYIRG